ncbi:MAG: hypothetical protein IJ708_10805 [Clostridia bacterium]|nr:hypothetical protein [Clostridia bacterium]
MIYSFQLCPHANIRYTEALSMLGKKELDCLLQSLGIVAQTQIIQRQKSIFYRFEAQELTKEQCLTLQHHSSLLLLCEEREGLLWPMPLEDIAYLPADLSEVLKYKGKTSARFTQMMITCACAAGNLFSRPSLTVLDPLCGRGTTLFCALQSGYSAIGLDTDKSAIREADSYFTRYLEMHTLKHQRTQGSSTLGGQGIPRVAFTLADTKEHYRAGDTRTLALYTGDTALTSSLLKKTPADLLVTDLPYGVQHAPGELHGLASFSGFLRRVLPAWYTGLKKGGVIVLSFNTLTLPRAQVVKQLEEAGFVPLTQGPYDDFSHRVEQAIVRDFVVALRP